MFPQVAEAYPENDTFSPQTVKGKAQGPSNSSSPTVQLLLAKGQLWFKKRVGSLGPSVTRSTGFPGLLLTHPDHLIATAPPTSLLHSR